jgi:hypothetical protein
MTDDDVMFHWPAADVAWHGEFDSERRYSIEHGVRVFVFNDRDALQRAVEREDINGFSTTYGEEDADGMQATIMLAQPVELSTVVHEVTHVGLLWHRPKVRRKQRAHGWLDRHPESIAELIGNLSTVIWHNIPAKHRA